MPKREDTPIGAPCWVDLNTSDPERATAFYGTVFGWVAQEPALEFGGYLNFTSSGVLVAGCMAMPEAPVHDVWSIYLSTDDARKTVETAAARGSQVIAPAMDVGDLGTMAVITDPGGAAIGMWEPKVHQGFGVVAEHGAPSWFELFTSEYVASIDFYRDVFHWDTSVVSDTDEFRYTTQSDGDQQFAGVMEDASGPTRWLPYFGVDDTDAALDTIVKLGGHVVTPAADTPYGRMAEATDPMGALFKLIHGNLG